MSTRTRSWIAGGLLGLVIAAPLAAQEQWRWPERGENLQKLPADFTGERLRAVMSGFTRALGVRCSYCHVGEEGQPLSTYDFASDDNPVKDRARDMLDLLGVVNDQLDLIDFGRTEQVNMWCHTCHAGRPIPHRLEEQLWITYEATGADAVVDEYQSLRERYYGRGAYDFGEPSLDLVGRRILAEGDFAGAVAVLALNVEHFPDSPDAHNRLGQAHRDAGDAEAAIEHYRRALEIDPENRIAQSQLRRLGVEPRAERGER